MNPLTPRAAWDALSYAEKLEVTGFIFDAITSGGPCSFRKMIYGKLGFKGDAYYPLYQAGGMLISNGLSEEIEGFYYGAAGAVSTTE